MEKVKVEKQGRILLPKKMRERLGVRSGEQLLLTEEKGEVRLRVLSSTREFSSALKGCIRKGKIDPLTVKKMWGM